MKEAGLALLMPRQRDYGSAIGVPEEPVPGGVSAAVLRWMKIIR